MYTHLLYTHIQAHCNQITACTHTHTQVYACIYVQAHCNQITSWPTLPNTMIRDTGLRLNNNITHTHMNTNLIYTHIQAHCNQITAWPTLPNTMIRHMGLSGNMIASLDSLREGEALQLKYLGSLDLGSNRLTRIEMM
jgi:hypothetical protein